MIVQYPLYSNPTLLEISLFWYFVAINIVYTLLLIFGAIEVYKRRRELKVEDFTYLLHSNALPEITFIIPMYNEQNAILNCLKSLINLSYRYKQIICVNDGSTDETMSILIKEFDLVTIPNFVKNTIPSEKILQIYRSKKNPEIIVIDKVHKGKYDAVNIGINACSDPYFIAIDADTFIDNQGFEAMIRPILANPNAVAVGATVRIKNGCTLEFNKVNTKLLTFKFLPIFQGIEYIRSFLQRQGWNLVGGHFVIAGACSIFPTEIIRNSGGFAFTVAEDMEIIVRLHHIMMKQNRDYKIFYLSDPVAWTEGPSSLKSLGRQRTNWHWGLLETLFFHKKMCLNPRYRFFGLLIYPFWIIAEALEPIAETVGYGIILWAWMNNTLNTPFFILLFAVSIGFSIVYSMVCLLIEELSFKKYSSLKTVFMLFLFSIVENIGYRQLNIYWRMRAFFKFFKNFKKTSLETQRIKKMME